MQKRNDPEKILFRPFLLTTATRMDGAREPGSVNSMPEVSPTLIRIHVLRISQNWLSALPMKYVVQMLLPGPFEV